MNNKSKKIEVSESNLRAAFEVADENTKKVLAALFGNIEPTDENKPSLKDYRTIRTYEDACKVLSENVDEEALKKAGAPKHIIAQMKLELVCKALWGGEVKVYPNPNGSHIYWIPWLALYSQQETDDMTDGQKSCMLSAVTIDDAHAYFGSAFTERRSSYTATSANFHLYLDTEEKAEYFGKQFLELWAEALAFNFSVGERLK